MFKPQEHYAIGHLHALLFPALQAADCLSALATSHSFPSLPTRFVSTHSAGFLQQDPSTNRSRDQDSHNPTLYSENNLLHGLAISRPTSMPFSFSGDRKRLSQVLNLINRGLEQLDHIIRIDKLGILLRRRGRSRQYHSGICLRL